MENNIDFGNLSKYKYAYKIYVSNGKLNSERVKLIYLNKKCAIILEGEEPVMFGSSRIYLEENLNSAIKEALSFWTRYGTAREFFVVSKRKLNSYVFNEDKQAKISIINKRIEDNKREIERNQRWIKTSQKEIERLEKLIVSMELEISEIKKESGEKE